MRDLDPIRERVDKATPGPWKRENQCVLDRSNDSILDGSGLLEGWAYRIEDAELIAHAPADLADLIEEVEQLREEVAEVRAQTAADGALIHAWHRESDTAADERDELRAQVERVRELHKPNETLSGVRYCPECTDGVTERYPCPTIRALEGDNVE